MFKAKFYIYRNLRKGGFSIKYKNKVIEISDNIIAWNIEFKVSQNGRNRVIQNNIRNVHAYAVCDTYFNCSKQGISIHSDDSVKEVWYNPFKSETFKIENRKIKYAPQALFIENKCFVYEDNK